MNLPEDLKHYRAPRPIWSWIIAVAAIIAYVGYVGPSDQAEQITLEAENKVLRAELAAAQKLQAHPSPPVVWSKKCARQGKQVYAWQSDAGAWFVRCVDADLRRAP